MKQTVNINLAGMQFVIDDDAYALLRDYLDTLTHLYHNSTDAAEIVEDVEMRIAELFSSQMASPNTIITLQMTQSVISRIGKPEDIVDVDIQSQPSVGPYAEEIDIESDRGAVPPPLPDDSPAVEKRLYRNPNDKLIGGVCSGVAKYIGLDPTWVRLAAVLLFFLSASTVAIVYIILWIVLPVADTPYKQMQMEGKSATFDNIGNTVNKMFSTKNPDPSRQDGKGFLSGFINVVMIIVAVVCFPIVFALLMLLLGLTIGIIGFLFGLPTIVSDTFIGVPGGEWLTVAVIGGCITILIPLISMIYMIFRGDKKTITKSGRISLLVIWIIGLLALITGSLVSARNGVINNIKHSPVVQIITENDEDDEDCDHINSVPGAAIATVDDALERVDSALDRVDEALDSIPARRREPSTAGKR